MECVYCSASKTLQFHHSPETPFFSCNTCGQKWFWKQEGDEVCGTVNMKHKTKDGVDRICPQCGGFLADQFDQTENVIAYRCLGCSFSRPKKGGKKRRLRVSMSRNEWQEYRTYKKETQATYQEFLRFKELKTDIASSIEELLLQFEALGEVLTSGDSCAEEYDEVDKTIRQLDGVLSEVMGRFPKGHRDLWEEEDDERARWLAETDRDCYVLESAFHKKPLQLEYHEVSIEDAEDDALNEI